MTALERQLLNYLFLASEAEKKQQWLGRDRFLILGMKRAAQAGLLPIAVRCREKVMSRSPRHLLTHFEDTVTTLQAEDAQVFMKQLERFCPAERAEQLATDLGFIPEVALGQQGDDLLRLLNSLLDEQAM